MRSASAVPLEEIVPRAGRRLGRRPCGDVAHGNVIDGHRYSILRAPVLRELIEPFVEGRDEMAPLHDRQRLRCGIGARDKGRGHGRSESGEGDRSAGPLEKSSSCCPQRWLWSSRLHLRGSCSAVEHACSAPPSLYYWFSQGERFAVALPYATTRRITLNRDLKQCSARRPGN